MLLRGLPPEAATLREPGDPWSTADYLLAAVLDTLRAANWLTVELNKRKGARNPPPTPTPRPGDGDKRRRPTRTTRSEKPPLISGAELADWLHKRKVG